MKRWVIGLLACIVSILVSIYLFIPNVIHFKRFVTVNATHDGLYRSLLSNKDWSDWWPGNVLSGRSSEPVLNYEYKKNTYRITGSGYSNLLLAMSGNHFTSKSTITVIPHKMDSLSLRWDAVIPTSIYPIKRLQIYFASQKLKKDLGSISNKMASHFSNPQNIYHIKIQNELVKDSFLVSTSDQSKTYPTTNDIYNLITKLKDFLSSQSAVEKGFPMLNISEKDSTTWLIRVAIPTDKVLENSSDISFKRMLGLGKILMTEIKGGPETVKKAFDQMGNYVNDYHYSSPAIPFLSLVTDRTKEPDTSIWKTRIYYPVR